MEFICISRRVNFLICSKVDFSLSPEKLAKLIKNFIKFRKRHHYIHPFKIKLHIHKIFHEFQVYTIIPLNDMDYEMRSNNCYPEGLEILLMLNLRWSIVPMLLVIHLNFKQCFSREYWYHQCIILVKWVFI